MRRVHPAKFPEMFRAHGVQPSRSTYATRDDEGCFACALGISAADKASFDEATRVASGASPVRALAKAATLSFAYASGLDDGWQGLPVIEGLRTASYGDGYADGAAAMRACRAAGLYPPKL